MSIRDRTIFTDRFEAAGNKPAPAGVDEIHDALTQGSFSFETTSLDSQKQSIRISLGKNSAMVVKLPGSEVFGLVEWYGKRSRPGRKASATDTEADTETTDAELPIDAPDDSGTDNSEKAAA